MAVPIRPTSLEECLYGRVSILWGRAGSSPHTALAWVPRQDITQEPKGSFETALPDSPHHIGVEQGLPVTWGAGSPLK